MNLSTEYNYLYDMKLREIEHSFSLRTVFNSSDGPATILVGECYELADIDEPNENPIKFYEMGEWVFLKLHQVFHSFKELNHIRTCESPRNLSFLITLSTETYDRAYLFPYQDEVHDSESRLCGIDKCSRQPFSELLLQPKCPK